MQGSNPTVEQLQEPIQTYLQDKHNIKGSLAWFQSTLFVNFAQELKIHQERGLDPNQVVQMKEAYGTNHMQKLKTKTIMQFFCQSFDDFILRILIVAAVISIVVQAIYSEDRQFFWVQGVTILLAVAVCSIVGTVNNYQKQKQFEDLFAISEQQNKYDVIRNGQNVELVRQELVVGDLIKLKGGLQIPADGLIVMANQLIVDQSSMTGQTQQIYKNTIQKCKKISSQHPPSPIVLSGTSIISGEGRMICLLVGEHSRQGKLNAIILDQEQQNKTPLQQKLQTLAEQIGYLGFGSGFIMFFLLTLWLIVSQMIPNGWDMKIFLPGVLQNLMLTVTIIVVAVPQGLPLAVTICLAYSVKQMLKQDNLVKRLACCQTMGSVHVICTDKTGTLTKNQMTVVQIWNGQLHQNILQKSTQLQILFGNQFYKDILYQSIINNSSAVLTPEPKGSPTELALLRFIQKLSPKNDKFNVKQERPFIRLPFSSQRKRSLTGIVYNGIHYLCQVGAAQVVLKSCKDYYHIQKSKQEVKNFEEEDIGKVGKVIKNMGGKALRVIAIAIKKLDSKPSESFISSKDQQNVRTFQKSGFTLLLLTGITDLARTQCNAAIQACQRAGITVVMVTGDNSHTAKELAINVGIIDKQASSETCMQGQQLMTLKNRQTKQNFEQKISKLKVLSRSQPEHKYQLVQAFRETQKVVAVTGDGTNDVPAFHKADIGIAMGKSGTQVAKNAADIIILNDDFSCIVRSIVWGRNIFLNVRKFLQFQLTTNVVACVFSVIVIALFKQSVLTTAQMLWINLIMDSLASLALSTQPPNSQELLNRPPVDKNQPIVTKTMKKHIIGQSIFQITVLLLLTMKGYLFLPEYKDDYDSLIGGDLQAKYYNGQLQGTMVCGLNKPLFGQTSYKGIYDKYHIYSRHLTFIFNVFVFMQIINFFCCRKVNDQLNLTKGLFSNKLFWIMVIVITFLQWVIIYLLSGPFKLYQYHGLTIQQWIFSLLIAFMTIPLSILLRLLPFAKPDYSNQPKEHQENSPNLEDDISKKNSNSY